MVASGLMLLTDEEKYIDIDTHTPSRGNMRSAEVKLNQPCPDVIR